MNRLPKITAFKLECLLSELDWALGVRRENGDKDIADIVEAIADTLFCAGIVFDDICRELHIEGAMEEIETLEQAAADLSKCVEARQNVKTADEARFLDDARKRIIDTSEPLSDEDAKRLGEIRNCLAAAGKGEGEAK